MEKAWQTVCAGNKPGPELQIEMRSATAYVLEVALDVTTDAHFATGLGRPFVLDNILQRCLRDLQVGATHLMGSDSTYELHGQVLCWDSLMSIRWVETVI